MARIFLEPKVDDLSFMFVRATLKDVDLVDFTGLYPSLEFDGYNKLEICTCPKMRVSLGLRLDNMSDVLVKINRTWCL